MRHFVLALAAAFAAVPASAQPFPPLRDAKAKVSAPLLVERYGAADLQEGELRLPAGKGPFPVAVLIHGGCWDKTFEGRLGLAPLADMLGKRGIATWNISYRRMGDQGGGWPGTFEDVSAGVNHVSRLAKRYPLDLRRSAFVGHSAGAHLALWAASRRQMGKPWSSRAFRPASVALIDGPATITSFVGPDAEVCGKPVIAPLLGGTPAERPGAYRIADPLNHIPSDVRILMVKGPLAFSMDPYETAAKARGVVPLSFSPPKAHHFDVITPGEPNGEATADWLAANLFAAARRR